MFSNSNNIRLLGTVKSMPVYDHTVFGEAFFKTELAARRLSGTEDLLPVTVSERLLSDMSIEPGRRLEVEGQIRSYNQHIGEGNRLIITVFAREISEPEGSEEDGDANEAELFGHICKPVVYRMTPFSREIADILVAVNRRYFKSDYLPAIAWGRNARFAEGLQCGDAIVLRGRLQSRKYTKTLPDGSAEQRTAYEISCSSVEKV